VIVTRSNPIRVAARPVSAITPCVGRGEVDATGSGEAPSKTPTRSAAARQMTRRTGTAMRA
jgi:hypothetical protein